MWVWVWQLAFCMLERQGTDWAEKKRNELCFEGFRPTAGDAVWWHADGFPLQFCLDMLLLCWFLLFIAGFPTRFLIPFFHVGVEQVYHTCCYKLTTLARCRCSISLAYCQNSLRSWPRDLFHPVSCRTMASAFHNFPK